ncbi:MAG: hypothetical protein LBR21_06545 [Propionibacteriaceae bacterium]|jgi:hypothetical protein|nr:hypothetical protein [Propionibacteriaceae bacterium]
MDELHEMQELKTTWKSAQKAFEAPKAAVVEADAKRARVGHRVAMGFSVLGVGALAGILAVPLLPSFEAAPPQVVVATSVPAESVAPEPEAAKSVYSFGVELEPGQYRHQVVEYYQYDNNGKLVLDSEQEIWTDIDGVKYVEEAVGNNETKCIAVGCDGVSERYFLEQMPLSDNIFGHEYSFTTAGVEASAEAILKLFGEEASASAEPCVYEGPTEIDGEPVTPACSGDEPAKDEKARLAYDIATALADGWFPVSHRKAAVEALSSLDKITVGEGKDQLGRDAVLIENSACEDVAEGECYYLNELYLDPTDYSPLSWVQKEGYDKSPVVVIDTVDVADEVPGDVLERFGNETAIGERGFELLDGFEYGFIAVKLDGSASKIVYGLFKWDGKQYVGIDKSEANYTLVFNKSGKKWKLESQSQTEGPA